MFNLMRYTNFLKAHICLKSIWLKLLYSTFISLIIISMGYFFWGVAQDHHKKLLLNDFKQKLLPHLLVYDGVQINMIVDDFAKVNKIELIELSDSSGSRIAIYGAREDDEFTLSLLEGGDIDDSRHGLISESIVHDGRIVGGFKLVWSPRGSTIQYLSIFMILLVSLTSAGLCFDYLKLVTNPLFPKSSEVVSDNAMKLDFFFEDVVKRMGLSIEFLEVSCLSNTNRVGAIGVNLRWNQDCRKSTRLTLAQLSSLIEIYKLNIPLIPWVIREMILEMKKKSQNQYNDDYVINVLGGQFIDLKFIQFVSELCNSINFPPSSLYISIGEDVLISLNKSEICRAWDLWKTSGFGVAVCNFGISSQSECLIEKFKIDKIIWDIEWIRRQWYFDSAKSRVLELQVAAMNAGAQPLIVGPLFLEDSSIIYEMNNFRHVR